MTDTPYTPGFWLPVCDARDLITESAKRARMYAVTREAWLLYLHMIVTAAINPPAYPPLGIYITGYNGFRESDRQDLDDTYAAASATKALEYLALYEDQKKQPRHWYHYGT